MSSLIIIRNISVEYANAVAGLTYGFPAITSFLGFTHALSLKVGAAHGVTLTETGVIAHSVNVLASGQYEKLFHQTRNPLTKNAATAPFNEEGKMHMTVTLLIKCGGEIFGDAGADRLAGDVERLAAEMRLAGGTITSIENVQVMAFPDGSKAKRVVRSLLPGFALVDAPDYLTENGDQIGDWLDVAAIEYSAGEPIDGKAAWERVLRGTPGYLVPITIGFRAVSELHAPGVITESRDSRYPFAFVEPVHGVGEWKSPHRFTDLNQMLWRYETAPGYYICNQAAPALAEYDFDDIDY